MSLLLKIQLVREERKEVRLSSLRSGIYAYDVCMNTNMRTHTHSISL